MPITGGGPLAVCVNPSRVAHFVSRVAHRGPAPAVASTPMERQPTKGQLFREVAYLHRDEAEAVERAAEKDRTSKSEIIRRAIRAYFEIED